MIAFWLLVKPHLRWLLPLLGMIVLVSGIYLKGRSDGKDACQRAQEAAEVRAASKAVKAGARADKAAQDASATIKKETDHAADRARVIVREITRDCPLPDQPDELRDLGREAVERARRALPAG